MRDFRDGRIGLFSARVGRLDEDDSDARAFLGDEVRVHRFVFEEPDAVVSFFGFLQDVDFEASIIEWRFGFQNKARVHGINREASRE